MNILSSVDVFMADMGNGVTYYDSCGSWWWFIFFSFILLCAFLERPNTLQYCCTSIHHHPSTIKIKPLLQWQQKQYHKTEKKQKKNGKMSGAKEKKKQCKNAGILSDTEN